MRHDLTLVQTMSLFGDHDAAHQWYRYSRSALTGSRFAASEEGCVKNQCHMSYSGVIQQMVLANTGLIGKHHHLAELLVRASIEKNCSMEV